MILRRITDAFRKQDWFTVGIETLIVVLGVFLGLQVNNWNAARVEHKSEQVLLLRLQSETQALLETQKEELAGQLPRREALISAHPVLFSLAPARPLTDEECRALAYSHWLPAPTDELPTLDEIISSGRFDLISSPAVKQALRAYAVLQERSRSAQAEAVSELFRLYSRHPEAIRIVLAPTEDPPDAGYFASRAGKGYRWSERCDIEKMRGSKQFLSEYFDNNTRLNLYLERYEQRIAALTRLDADLAEELGSPRPYDTQDGSP